MHTRTWIAAVSVACLCLPLHAAEADARKSIALLSHWQCFQWSRMAGEQAATETHFNAGMEAGRTFLAAARAGTITKEEADSIVPMTIVLTMSGPSTEFVLGRIFETVTTDAFNDIAKEDPSGMPRDPKDYITDDGLLKSYAEMKYRSANCGLLP
jgi:hypothetical protein